MVWAFRPEWFVEIFFSTALKFLLLDSEKEIFYKFKIHADAFEHNQLQRHDHDAVPLFPNEFEQMIFKEDL